MSQPTWGEANQANWKGILPAVDGEYLKARYIAVGATSTVYTVPASQVFLLWAYSWDITSPFGAAGQVYASVLDSGGSPVWRFCRQYVPANNYVHGNLALFAPIELVAGDFIQLSAPVTNLVIELSISGVLVNA